MDQNQSSTEWTFVTALEPGQFQHPSARWLVKSSVKRHYLRSRRSVPRSSVRSIAPRISAADAANSQEASSSGSQRSSVHDDVQTNYHGAAALTSASFVPDWMLGTHVWRTEDAMALFNIPRQFHAYYSDAIHHYLTVIVPVWIPIDEHGPSSFVDNQMKTCMKSPLLLECLIGLSFSHQDCLYGRPQGYRARKHIGEAAKMINSSLDTGELEDSAIMAVAQMCITSATLAANPTQIKQEHLKEVEIHMDGMETMVKLRGGIYKLGMNGALNEIICWVDQLVAELTAKPPRFAPPPGSPAIPLVDVPQFALDLTSPVPWSIFMLAPQSTELDNSILSILSQLARLTRMQASLEQNPDQAQHGAFEQWLALIEQHITAYLTRALAVGSHARIELFREASCVAGAIYTQLQFRNSEIDSVNLQMLKERLVAIFVDLDTKNIAPDRLQSEGPFLLWILFCGGILCLSSEEMTLFVERIMRLVDLLGMKEWKEVDSMLRGYLWTGKLGNWGCEILWDEVEMARYRMGLMNIQGGFIGL